MNEVVNEMETALKEKLKVNEIDKDKELRTLGLDSLDIVELLLKIEDKFHIVFTSDELKKLKKVSDLYEAIEAKTTK